MVIGQKLLILTYPFLHLSAPFGVTEILGIKNYDPWTIVWCCLHDPTLSCFDTITSMWQIGKHRAISYTTLAWDCAVKNNVLCVFLL